MRKSIRVNTIKTSIEEAKQKLSTCQLEQVPWCKEGFFIKGFAIGNSLEHFLGHIYLQGAASMIPALVLEPKETDIVLDLCASPGSKTSQIASYMGNKGLIIANDVKISRMKPLVMNLQRCGVANTITSLMEGKLFANFENTFDRVLVDAPCSGLGTIMKSKGTILSYNPNMLRKFSSIQKSLLCAGFEALKQGGTLVYSTCTIEPEENEGVVSALLERHSNAGIEQFEIPIKRSLPITSFDGKIYNEKVKNCLRIYPQDNFTEGFFVAKIKKT
ncbi:NOL1/NOP2/sun family putative RNA methylase [archaeon]|nr:NOL1/NOP2/sun family putative RNA methylase [archaeon]